MKLVNIKKIYFGGRKRLEQWYSLLSTKSSNLSYLMEPTDTKKKSILVVENGLNDNLFSRLRNLTTLLFNKKLKKNTINKFLYQN